MKDNPKLKALTLFSEPSRTVVYKALSAVGDAWPSEAEAKEAARLMARLRARGVEG